MDRLRHTTDEIDLHPRCSCIPHGAMSKSRKIEVRSQLAIEADEEIQIEGRGHARCVVIGCEQRLGALYQVHAEQQRVPTPKAGASSLQQERRLGRLKIADARSDIED